MKYKLCSVLTALLLLYSCKKEASAPAIVSDNDIIILNQGVFLSANGDISLFNRDTKKVTNNVFQSTNNRPVGDVLQSAAKFNGKYYLVANNGGKIEIATEGSLKEAGVINGLKQPRYFLGISSSKAYVSEWGDSGTVGTVAVIDLTKNTVTKRISTGKGAEGMVKIGNSVYVACSGGYLTDSTVTIIDAASDAVTNSFTVKPGPNSFAIDVNNKLWVLCGGSYAPDYSLASQPSLVCINTADNSIVSTSSMTGSFSLASNLCINVEKNKLFFGLSYGTGIYAMDITGGTITSVINQSAFGLGIDPKNNNILCTDSKGGKSNGILYRYTQDYKLIDSASVGLYPGGFLF